MTALLDQPTLVLNRNWQPVSVSTVSRSLVLVYSGQARVVDPQSYQLYDWEDWSQLAPRPDEPAVRTCTLRLRVPEVVTLAHFEGAPVQKVAFSRRNLFKRDHYTCQYCGVQPGSEELTIDHVVPRSRGGQSTWENCVLACVACNKRKADRILERSGLKLLHKPKRPKWKPLYAGHDVRLASWDQFLSEAYWSVELEP
jgi:5-methylcytosine-specific restriction endonuclease McrA